MVTVQGWANVQLQFDRLVHFECKPRPKEDTLLQIWSNHQVHQSPCGGVKRSHDLVSESLGLVLPLASQVTFGNTLLFSSLGQFPHLNNKDKNTTCPIEICGGNQIGKHLGKNLQTVKSYKYGGKKRRD